MAKPTTRVPTAPTEWCSDDEDPFGHGDALDAEMDRGPSTLRQRNEHESFEEHVNKSRALVIERHHFSIESAADGERQHRDC